MKKESEKWNYFREELKRIKQDITNGNYTGAAFELGHLHCLSGRYEYQWQEKEGE